MGTDVDISDLIGKTITGIENDGDELIFHVKENIRYKMYHSQSCCEHVYIDDIEGDLNDLIDSPILQAEAPSTEGMSSKKDYDDSFTWTFYKLATIKGYVTIKWYGHSNGYYSERVDFVRM